jgi:hypothetical protein
VISDGYGVFLTVTGFLAIYGVFHGAYGVISDGYGVFLMVTGFFVWSHWIWPNSTLFRAEMFEITC